MSFIVPMMAASMPKNLPVIRPGEWVVQEKFDGHRIIVQVGAESSNAPGLLDRADLDPRMPAVAAWSRDGLPRVLPLHLLKAFQYMPLGTYDGELIPPANGRSYGVTDLRNRDALSFALFDVLLLRMQEGAVNITTSMVMEPYRERHSFLASIFSVIQKEELSGDTLLLRERCKHILSCVQLAPSMPISSMEDVYAIAQTIWDRDGEGVILKRLGSIYSPGKRPKGDWIKIKQLRTAVLEVIGFLPSQGELNDRGPFAIVKLRDDEGNETTVKTRNDAELAKLSEGDNVIKWINRADHPALGRKLRIDFQERTPDGSYRHPRWDRWEDE